MINYLFLLHQQKNVHQHKEKKQSDNKNYWYIAGLAVIAAVDIVSPLYRSFGDAAALVALGSALSQ